MHPLTVSAAFLAISSAFLLYGLSYETRQIEARVARQEKSAEIARSDIAVLKAERAHLSRPDRIEPFARAQGMRPMEESQVASGATDKRLTTGAIAR